MAGQLSTKELRQLRYMNPVFNRLRMDSYLADSLGGVAMTGNVYYCDPTSGSDAFDGKTSENAKKTLQAAIDLCENNNGDVIVRMRGGEAVTSPVNFNKSGVTVIPQGYGMAPLSMGEYFSTYSTTLTADPVAIITADGVIQLHHRALRLRGGRRRFRLRHICPGRDAEHRDRGLPFP